MRDCHEASPTPSLGTNRKDETLTEPGADEELLEFMREQLKKDPQKSAAVDMTALGLMEMTRKKQKKTLKEQAKECGIL